MDALLFRQSSPRPLRRIDNPRTIDDARDGLCQPGDVVVEVWTKGLFVGRCGRVAIIFWDSTEPNNERFLALCETFDARLRNLRRKTGGTTHKSPRKRAAQRERSPVPRGRTLRKVTRTIRGEPRGPIEERGYTRAIRLPDDAAAPQVPPDVFL